MEKIFISYTGADTNFATWVAEILEKNDCDVTIQAWDFRPGDNFIKKIDSGLKDCKKMIIILSNNYLKSEWCKAEWTSKIAEQIENQERVIIPIRIEPVELKGLLKPLVYIDVVDKDETTAKRLILDGINDVVNRISVDGYPSYFNVEHQQIDNDYHVFESKIIFKKTCTTKILTDGLNKIHNRITWFADETIDLVSLTDGVSIEKIDLRDTNLNYNVVFNRALQKNEEVTYTIQAILSNNNKHFKNFFSTEVITPLKQLNVHLTLEDINVKKYYTQKISNSPMNVRTELPKEYNYVSPSHWYVPNPELNFEYKIFW